MKDFCNPYEAYVPVEGGFDIAHGYSPLDDFETMLRQEGWQGQIKFRPMTKWIKKKHGWGRDTDPGGPWGCTIGFAETL